MGDDYSLGMVIGASIIGGGLFGWIGFYISAALLRWSRGLLKGTGRTQDLLRIVAYSLTPGIISMLLTVVLIIHFGNAYFQSDDSFIASTFDTILYLGVTGVQVLLFVWWLILICLGISVAHQFSILKSVLSIVIALLALFIPLFIILSVLLG
jgi:hypothetical protein